MTEKAPFSNQYLSDSDFKEILPVFISELEKTADDMRIALEHQNINAIKRYVHALKGGSLSYGAYRLYEICEALETTAEYGEIATMTTEINQLVAETNRIVQYAHSHFGITTATEVSDEEKRPFDQILLIDDDPAVCAYNKALLKHLFPESDLFIFTAADQALIHLKALPFPAEKKARILILVDFYMPELDGFEFMDELEEMEEGITEHLHVFLLTLVDDVRTKEMVQKYPMIKAMLKKPLNAVLLESMLPLEHS